MDLLVAFPNLAEILKNPYYTHVLSSILLLLVALVVRMLLISFATRSRANDAEYRRRWIVHSRNITALVVLFGFAFIWGEQLRTLALSIVAIAAALVLATKELIMCVSGELLRASSSAYNIGDRIEINGLRGDVVDMNVFSTSILEIGPDEKSHQLTGRVIRFPNSFLLTHSLINESYLADYLLHHVEIPLRDGEDWEAGEALLLRIANEECAQYIKDSGLKMKDIRERHALEVPDVNPRINLVLGDGGAHALLLRIPTPANRKGRTEQAIIRRFVREFRAPANPA